MLESLLFLALAKAPSFKAKPAKARMRNSMCKNDHIMKGPAVIKSPDNESPGPTRGIQLWAMGNASKNVLVALGDLKSRREGC